MHDHRAAPAAPACPIWCDTHESRLDGWDVYPQAITKRCESTATVRDEDDEPVTVTLEAFADVDAGAVRTDSPRIRLELTGALTLSGAAALAVELLRLVDLAREPV